MQHYYVLLQYAITSLHVLLRITSITTITTHYFPAQLADARADMSPPPPSKLDRLLASFHDLQSELTLYKNEVKPSSSPGNKHNREAQHRPKSSRQDRHTAYAAGYDSRERELRDPDTIDQQYALAARAHFDAQAAHSVEWVRSHADDVKSREFFGLPSDDEEY
jgi:hypothetical protein